MVLAYLARCADMVSKAARSQNRGDTVNGLSQFAAPHFSDQDPPLGPTSPGGGHGASVPVADDAGYQSMPSTPSMGGASPLHPAEQMAQETDNRIRAITSQPMVEDSDDDL